VADVIAVVNFARENNELLAIRGGGHNGPGLALCDDGIVLDLSMMKGIRVDPAARTARVAPGAKSTMLATSLGWQFRLESFQPRASAVSPLAAGTATSPVNMA